MQRSQAAALLALAALACQASAQDAADAFGMTSPPPPEAGAQGSSPAIKKVVTLLKDMQKQLLKEAEEDEAIYEEMKCWCVTNDREKTKSIGEAEQRITDLTSAIEEGTAASARLNTEIKNLEKEITANAQALDKADSIRQKELAEFNAEEKELLQTIQTLKNAIVVLSKHHGGSFMQLSSRSQGAAAMVSKVSHSEKLQIASVLSHVFKKHADLLEGVITPSQKKLATQFLQNPDGFLQTVKSEYAPQSGEIFGILNAMKESFEQNLADMQKDESDGRTSFGDLKTSKESEIAAGQGNLDAKTQELATTDEKLAADKQDLADTEASLAADEKFLAEVKEKCAMQDKEYEERVKERNLEIEAVGKALELLTSEEAHKLFSSTFSFVQKQSAAHTKRRAQASKVLARVAQKNRNPRLAALAVQVKLDGFKRVKKAIQDMIDQLLKEKKDEIKHKDFCVENLNANQRETENKEREKKDLIEKIDDLTMTIDELTKAIDTLKSEIAELQLNLKHAGEDRAKENAEFQLVVADQRATQKLLAAAMKVLQNVYEKKMALLQKKQPEFKEYKKNESGGGVIGMMKGIIADAKKLEAEAILAEDDAQKAYEDFVKDSNFSIEEKKKSIINKSEDKAKAEDEKTQAETDKADVMTELEQLGNEAADLHKACDYVLKNFDVRQTARDEEIEALKQAIAILSGAKF